MLRKTLHYGYPNRNRWIYFILLLLFFYCAYLHWELRNSKNIAKLTAKFIMADVAKVEMSDFYDRRIALLDLREGIRNAAKTQ